MEVERYLDKIAARLRAWRAEAGMTLQQVAGRSGVAASTIQKVESQQMVPTIAVLFKIARGLDRSPVELIDDAQGLPEVALRSPEDDDSGDAMGKDGLLNLTGKLVDAQLSTWRVQYDPGQGVETVELGSNGEMLVLCERGRLDVRVGDQLFTLTPGASLHFKTRLPVGWRAAGDAGTQFMLVGSDTVGLGQVLERSRVNLG